MGLHQVNMFRLKAIGYVCASYMLLGGYPVSLHHESSAFVVQLIRSCNFLTAESVTGYRWHHRDTSIGGHNFTPLSLSKIDQW